MNDSNANSRRDSNTVCGRPDSGSREVGGVLLAAGRSTRFDSGNKLLARVEGRPIVCHAVESLRATDLASIVVVVGHEADRIRDAIDEGDVSFRYNGEYKRGQSTSVRAGIEVARRRSWNAVLFALGDMPFVRPDSIRALLDAYHRRDETVFATSYRGTRGNPVLFDECHFDALSDVSGDRGGRRLVTQNDDAVLVETDDPGVTRDVDYEADIDNMSISGE